MVDRMLTIRISPVIRLGLLRPRKKENCWIFDFQSCFPLSRLFTAGSSSVSCLFIEKSVTFENIGTEEVVQDQVA